MSEFEYFKKFILDGNLDGVKSNIKEEFIEKLIDNSSQKRAIHYASGNGHFDIVKFLIEQQCDFESETKTKMRPIHFASKDGYIDILQLLIDSKCDIECETQYKRRPIHLACSNGHINVVKLLINNNCDLESETQNKRRPIHCSCLNGNVELFQLLINSKCNLESETQNKWKPIHYACEKGQIDIVKLLMDNKCDPESESEDKWRPIHCACLKGHTEVVKLLVSNGCDIHWKTKEGNTPLNVAQKQGHVECMEYLNEVIKELRKTFDCVKQNNIEEFIALYNHKTLSLLEYPTGATIVDVAIQCNADAIIQYLKEKKVEREELIYMCDWKHIDKKLDTYRTVLECLFYRSIRFHQVDGFHRLCFAELINGPHRFIPAKFLDLAAEFGTCVFIKDIINKTVYNGPDWDRAQQVAAKHGHTVIVPMIENRQSLLLLREKAEMSILHTSIYDNDVDMVNYLLNHRIVDRNVNNKTFGSGLTLAYSICHVRCVHALIKFNINPNITNKYLQTPLYAAMDTGILDFFEYVLDRTTHINTPAYMGFTVVQYAVVKDYPDLCEMLLRKGGDCAYVTDFTKMSWLIGSNIPSVKSKLPLTSKENCLTLNIKIHSLIYPCFLDILNENMVNICDCVGDSLLHLAAKAFNSDLCLNLIRLGIPVDKLNDKGYTPLFELLSYINGRMIDEQDQFIAILHIFLDAGAVINRKTNNGINVLKLANVFVNESAMVQFLKKIPRFKAITVDDLKHGLSKNWFEYTEMLMLRISNKTLSKFITKEIFLHCLISLRTSFIRLLFGNASIDIKNSIMDKVLSNAGSLEDEELFDDVIKSDLTHLTLLETGESLLTDFIITNRNDYIMKIIQSKKADIYINFKNANKQYPLQVAIENDSMMILEDLIAKTNNFNDEDLDGVTILALLFKKISTVTDELMILQWKQIVKLIIGKGGDIYMINSRQTKVIDECLNEEIRAEIEQFVKTSKQQERIEKIEITT